MKKLSLIAIACLLMQSCANDNNNNAAETTDTTESSAVAQKASRLNEISWLLGDWEAKKGPGYFIESWAKQNDSIWDGAGTYFDSTGRRLMSEQLQLLALNDTLWYLPTVSNQNNGKPVKFKEKSITASEVVFENLQHDFPQRIVYQKLSDSTMLAYIEGTVNGKLQRQDFPFAHK